MVKSFTQPPFTSEKGLNLTLMNLYDIPTPKSYFIQCGNAVLAESQRVASLLSKALAAFSVSLSALGVPPVNKS